ncbi:Protein JINGUBANG [Bienertia sinuspersici]
MDPQLSDKKTYCNFFDEEEEEVIEDHSPSFQHLSKHSPSPFLPQSPESSWSCSPSLTPPHPSLLYCCISSLHRDGDIYSIAVSSDLVLTGSNSRRVYAWQSFDCHAKGYLQASSGEVRTMLSYDNLLFTSHKDHKIRIWNMRTFGGNFRARKVISLPNASHFKNFIRRSINPQYYKLTSKLINPQHKDIISCMAYYHVEGILYTGSYDRTVKTWKLRDKKCIDSFIAHEDHINDMVVNQHSGYLFTCSSDGTVKMWVRVYGECCHVLIKVFSFHTYPIYALSLGMSPSQRSFLYSGSSDGCINFWVQGMSTHYSHGGVLEGHQFAVLCLVSVENLVISGSEDSTIRIWRRERGRVVHDCLAVLEGHRGPVRCLAASLQDINAMSFLVYSASLDQTFKVWRVKLLREIKKSHGHRLSNGDDIVDDGNCSPSPVLSPSWVKKKLKCRSLK